MFKKIDHIGIAVRSIEASLPLYAPGLGFNLSSTELLVEHKVRVAMLPIGAQRLELLEPVGEDSPIARFIARRGEGLHHVCFQVEDVASELKRLEANGVRLVDSEPRPGANGCLVAFIHPESAAGVLIELSQKPCGKSNASSK